MIDQLAIWWLGRMLQRSVPPSITRVHLSKDQREMAAAMGITDMEYAINTAKVMRDRAQRCRFCPTRLWW